jgi:hypothetical protein
MSQEFMRAKHFVQSEIFPHGVGIQGIPIELPFSGHQIASFVILGSGCTGLLATFSCRVEGQTKGPTESSDGPRTSCPYYPFPARKG